MTDEELKDLFTRSKKGSEYVTEEELVRAIEFLKKKNEYAKQRLLVTEKFLSFVKQL